MFSFSYTRLPDPKGATLMYKPYPVAPLTALHCIVGVKVDIVVPGLLLEPGEVSEGVPTTAQQVTHRQRNTVFVVLVPQLYTFTWTRTVPVNVAVQRIFASSPQRSSL